MTDKELMAWADAEALSFFGPDPVKLLLRQSFAARLVAAWQSGRRAGIEAAAGVLAQGAQDWCTCEDEPDDNGHDDDCPWESIMELRRQVRALLERGDDADTEPCDGCDAATDPERLVPCGPELDRLCPGCRSLDGEHTFDRGCTLPAENDDE